MSGQVTITQLPTASALTGNESVPIVQNGVTKQTTTGAIATQPTQTQTFLTVGQQPSLANSRQIGVSTGLTFTDGGAQGTYTIAVTGALSSLISSGTGIQVKTDSTTLTPRQITTGTGLSVTNADGVSGNPQISLASFLASIQSLSGSTGLVGVNGGAATSLAIAGVTNQTVVTNPSGAAGNPTIGIYTDPILPGNASVTIPTGTTAQRNGSSGAFRYNTTLQQFEGLTNVGWSQFSLSGGVTSFSAGSTGLTPSTGTTGAVTLAGVLNTSSGGTGVNSPTGYLYGNGASVMTASTTIPTSALTGTFPTSSLSGTITNAQLANSSLTINGTSIALGASGTVTATASNALTIGTGLSGSSYNGSSPVTIAIDSTVATLTGTQVLTNKSISGATNTLTSIPNSALTNNTVTIGTTAIALGGSSTTLSNLTSILLTQDPTSALQVATKQYVDNATSAGLDIHTACIDDSDSNLASTYANGGTTPTWTSITTTNTVNTGSAHGLSINDVIVFGSTTNGITSGTAYFVQSVPSSTSITLSLTYNGAQITTLTNGTGLSITSLANAGVGATLTSTSNGPLVLEGYTAVINDRILVLGQTTATQNGAYYVSQVGVTSVSPWILTRATDANKYIPNSNQGLDQGAYFLISGGGDAGEAYVCSNIGTIVFGTTNITFAQFSSVPSYSAGTGLTLSSNQFSITNTAVTAGSYTNANITVNAQGQITAAASGAAGGVTSFQTSLSGLTPSSGTTGAVTLAGTLGATSGGTGFGSYATGDILYASSTTALSKLTIGATNYVLTSSGTAPQFVAQSTLSVGTATNATNVALSAGTGATNYIPFATSATGNQALTTNASFTYNYTNNAITGGINGGTF